MNTEETSDSLSFLNKVFQGNIEHVNEIQEELSKHVDGQDPSTTTVACCDSRVMQQEMWKNKVVGSEFTKGVIGNHVNVYNHKGEETISGSIDYIPEHSDTPTVVIVIGHTGCGAVTATYETLQAIEEDQGTEDLEIEEADLKNYNGETEGINTDIRLLMSAGLTNDYREIKGSAEKQKEVDILVERNVDNQIELLKQKTQYTDTEFVGLIYDLDGMYDSGHGKLYLTNLNGDKDLETLEEKASNYENIDAARLS